jgi:MoxR-like ATPase
MSDSAAASEPADETANGGADSGSPAVAEGLEAVRDVAAARDHILGEVRKRIVGQAHVVDQLLTALLARGHCLFVGVPGLAKTLLISTLAEVLELQFSRIQFTPDLMPSDITGTDVLEEDHTTGKRTLRFIKGPVFCNILLADEINRTPPKTQAALLQSMQEYNVTAGGETFALPLPFHVFATQNPIEQEGTYPLPEAQLDRFMFMVRVDYPSADEEIEVVRSTTGGYREDLTKVLGAERIRQLQDLVPSVPAADHVVRYAVDLVRSTRPDRGTAPDFVEEFVSWGAGPRASQYLVLAAKARAVLHGRFAAEVDDVRSLAPQVLGHRIVVNFHAEAERVSADDLVARLLDILRPPTA